MAPVIAGPCAVAPWMQTNNIAVFRQIVDNWQAEEHNGVLIDATSANAVVQVFDALSEKNKIRYNAMSLIVMVQAAWGLV